MDKSKFICDFVVVRPNLGFEHEFAETGAGVRYLLASPDKDTRQYISDVEKLLLGNYDVVHLHTSYWKRLLIEEIAMECKIPKVIVHSHNTQIDIADEEKRKAAEKVHWELREKFDTSFATDFCACSWKAADWLFGSKIPKEKVKILHNAIDIEKFSFKQDVRDKYRELLGLEDRFVIGHIGRLSAQKNHDFLIDVFYEVTRTMNNVKLMLIGKGPLENILREKVKKLGLSDKVLFLGQRQDVSHLLQAMDLFCLPSKFEGFPISVIEALAAGLPTVVSDKITPEIGICPEVSFVPLKADLWKKIIVQYYKDGVVREDTKEVISNLGYNLKSSVKIIEKLYSH